MLDFNELGLNPQLVEAVKELGFQYPMPIQSEIIPFLVNNPKDIVGLAQTGTGKTAAFGLPILHHIDTKDIKTQALILCPTRELCLQIARDIEKYAKHLKNIKVSAVYGGASIEMQIKELNKAPHIIVATPGRLNDMIRRKKVNLSHIKWVVLDEADEMLDMGFQEDVDLILQTTPNDKHTLLFSATMPEDVERLLTKYMKSPEIKSVGKRNSGSVNIKHIYYLVNARNRYLALKRIADFTPRIYALIFCRTRRETQEIADLLIKDGYNADSLHGDLSQAARESVMNKFRSRNIQMLVATDVAARGLDVNDLTHVVNYNLPDDTEVYIHRSGRTGRADKTGVCISIINLKEKFKIKAIEKSIGREFAKAKLPSGKQVCEKRLFYEIDRMENVELNPEIEPFLPLIYKKLEWIEKEDIIKRFVSLEFNRFLEYYKDAKDLNADENTKEDSRKENKEEKRNNKTKRGKRDDKASPARVEDGFTRFFISVGRKDRTSPQSIIGLINETTKTRNIVIGKIDIMENFSFVDIDSKSADIVKKAFKNNKRKTNVKIEVASKHNDKKN